MCIKYFYFVVHINATSVKFCPHLLSVCSMHMYVLFNLRKETPEDCHFSILDKLHKDNVRACKSEVTGEYVTLKAYSHTARRREAYVTTKMPQKSNQF